MPSPRRAERRTRCSSRETGITAASARRGWRRLRSKRAGRWLVRPGGRLTEPVLIDDVGLVSELAPVALQESMPLGSICAVPLAYRGRTLGALVALAPQRRTFLPRDVDLLRSYAVQAAIALVNARLFEMQERLAARDPLTGLLNRRQLHEHLD